jgi:hypothetical protein
MGPAALDTVQANGNGSVSAENISGTVITGHHNTVITVSGNPVSTEQKREEKAHRLNTAVLNLLTREVEQLRLKQNVLPIRWQSAFQGARDIPSGTSPASLSDLAGQLNELRPKDGWLLVLGREGSGKSILALQFAKSLAEQRVHDHTEPIPVIFSLGSWNPGTTAFRNWLIQRLERDHPFLAEKDPEGTTWAAALVEGKHILPVLDGFDEIVAARRLRALTQLNESFLPLVVTSRREAIDDVKKESGVVPAAVAIELVDLGLADSLRYLCKATRTPPPDGSIPAEHDGWPYVLGMLGARPHAQAVDRLAAVLATPLMTTLARFAYESGLPGHDPADLLDTEKFETREALEKHLLDFFVRTAYERFLHQESTGGENGEGPPEHPWSAERARHWLGCLAAHLTKLDTTDIEWWRLGTSMPLRWIMLRVGITVGVVTGLVAGLVYGAETALLYGPAEGFAAAGLTGLGNGTAAGLTFGLMHGFVTRMKVGGPMFEPSRMEITLRGWTKEGLRKGFRPRVGGGLAGGLLFGLLWAGGVAGLCALQGFPGPAVGRIAVALLADGIGLGLVLGLIAALGAGFEKVIKRDGPDVPSDLLDTNRATVLTQLATVGVVVGTGYGITFGLTADSALAGLGAGLVSGCMIALGIGTMTAWGRWLVLARIWLPLTERLPSDLDAFLRDAYARGVLRRQGAVYQFRHARLQEHLGEAYEK